VADDRDSGSRTAGPGRGLSVPCFAEDPADLVDLGVGAERAGLDGYFLWDHLVHADVGEGPPVVDPWQVLAVDSAGRVAAHLPGYRAAGATWWVESPGSQPGWLEAVRERLRDPAGDGAEVQSPRG